MAAFLKKEGYGIFNYGTAGVQEVINLPSTPGGFTVQLTPTGGNSQVEVSNDGVAFTPWVNGAVAVSTTAAVLPMRFLRVNNTTASASRVAILRS